MIFGFNTDVQAQDAVYHVQTEDRGQKNPVIESIVYVGGKILEKKRTPYDPAVAGKEQVEEAVRHQHKELTEAIRTGAWVPGQAAAAAASEPVADSLAEDAGYRIELSNLASFHQGEYFRFQLLVRNASDRSLADNVSVQVRWLVDGEVRDEQSLKSRPDGGADVWVAAPEFSQQAALVLQASGARGNTLAKYAISPVA